LLKENYHYRLIHKITDESFDLQKLNSYRLFLALGKYATRFCVLDVTRNKFIYLEDYEVSNIFTPGQAAQVFKEVFSEHSFLFKPDWQQIKVLVKNHNFTLIPNTLFEAEAAADYLRLNCDLAPEQEEVFTYNHSRIDAINIFSVDKSLMQVWPEVLPQKTIQYRHLTSALISGLLHYGERSPEKRLYAFIEKESMCLLVLREGHLEFCNLFSCKAPEDFLYYLLFVMQEQKLNPDADRLTIWGDLDHDSALFSHLRTYIRFVQFGARLTGVNYSYKLEDIFQHYYLDLYSLFFCE